MKKIKELDAQTAAPDFWNDTDKARSVLREATRQRFVLAPYQELCRTADDAELMLELADDETDEKERRTAVAAVNQSLERASKKMRDMEMRALLSDRFDANNAYLMLHAGAGGTEACDWADMLLRMYRRYCEEHGFAMEMLDVQAGDEAGIKSCQAHVVATGAYGYLKAERGVHRLVRISPFDSNKRRHTSFVSLDIVAEIDEDIEVDLRDEDLRVDTYRSSGAGGQHVNTTDSAIRITHLPSGIVVSCQAERSQHKNRSQALKMLRARLYEWQLDRQRRDMEKFYGEKGEIAWGSQIRSYVLQPYTMVKDHRTDTSTSNVNAVLDGGLDAFIEAYLKKNAAENARREAS